MRAAEFSLREQQIQARAGSVNETQRDDETVSTRPKIQSRDPYRRERRRIDTAARWNDIQKALGWGGVLFNNWMPSKWFNVRRVSKEEWNMIVAQLQSVQPRFNGIIRGKLPDFSQILLSHNIAC